MLSLTKTSLFQLFAHEFDKRQAVVTKLNAGAKSMKSKLTSLHPPCSDINSYHLPERVASANEHWDSLCHQFAEFEAARDVGHLNAKTRAGVRELSEYLVLVDYVMVEQKRMAWHVPSARRQDSVVKVRYVKKPKLVDPTFSLRHF